MIVVAASESLLDDGISESSVKSAAVLACSAMAGVLCASAGDVTLQWSCGVATV